MKTLAIGLVTSFLALSAATKPEPVSIDSCRAHDNHTNPPIVGGKGNSVQWFQCKRSGPKWVPLTPTYKVFNAQNKCVPSLQFLDDDWFGTGTESATLLDEQSLPVSVSEVTLTGGTYTLKIKYVRPDPTKYSPNEITLCHSNGTCCPLAPDPNRRGMIPHEFKDFNEQIKHGADGKGMIPLLFETCKNIGCQH